MDNNKKTTLSVISLFSGGGFLDLGFMNNGFSIESSLEINQKFIYGYNLALKQYEQLTDNYYFVNKLVKVNEIKDTTDVSNIKNHNKAFSKYKGVTGVIGGPPCQDYSVGGKNKGAEGERGRLIYSYLEFIEMIKPQFLFFENVEGLYKNKKHKRNFDDLIYHLEIFGYDLWYDVINPLNYGFPQDRPRIIIIGFQKNIVKTLKRNGFLYEKDNQILKQAQQGNYVFKWPKEKFTNPKAFRWPKKWKFQTISELQYNDLIPIEYESLQIRSAFKGLDKSVPNQDEHFNPTSNKFYEIDEGDTNRKSFKRLHRFRYSPTVAYGNNEVHLHPTKPRRLTVREALRIQTVPDEYILPKDLTLTSKFQMISNGVPVGQAELISAEIRRTIINYYNCL